MEDSCNSAFPQYLNDLAVTVQKFRTSCSLIKTWPGSRWRLPHKQVERRKVWQCWLHMQNCIALLLRDMMCRLELVLCVHSGAKVTKPPAGRKKRCKAAWLKKGFNNIWLLLTLFHQSHICVPSDGSEPPSLQLVPMETMNPLYRLDAEVRG